MPSLSAMRRAQKGQAAVQADILLMYHIAAKLLNLILRCVSPAGRDRTMSVLAMLKNAPLREGPGLAPY